MRSFLRGITAALLLLVLTSVLSGVQAQPLCNSQTAPNAVACQAQAVAPQATDILLGQQANGPQRQNQNRQIFNFSIVGKSNLTGTVQVNGHAMTFPTSAALLAFIGAPVTSGNCAQFSSSTGQLVDAGFPCGAGSTNGVTFTDGTHSVANATQLTVSGATVGGTAPNATLTVALSYPPANYALYSTGSALAGVAPSAGCLQSTGSGAPFFGGCGGSATIQMEDFTGTSISAVAKQFLGPGFLLSGATGLGVINLNQPDRLVTTCSGTPSPCTITANDMGGQVNFNGTGLTATIPAITLVTPNGTASSTALTLSSGTGVSVGDAVDPEGNYYPPGTIIVSGSGTSWVTNNAPTTPLTSQAVTISFGAAGQGVTLTNRNASDLTVVATLSAINGYPGGPYLVPQNGGLPLLSNGATWDAIGPVAPDQAFLGKDQTWTGTQTWGPSHLVPNVVTGTSYTLQASDDGGVIFTTNSAGVTITTDASFPIGYSVAITQVGTGQVTIANGTGATLTTAVNSGGATHTRAQYSKIGLDVTSNTGSNANFNLVGDGS